MMLLSYIRPSLHVIVRTRPLTGSMPIFKPQSFTAGYRKLGELLQIRLHWIRTYLTSTFHFRQLVVDRLSTFRSPKVLIPRSSLCLLIREAPDSSAGPTTKRKTSIVRWQGIGVSALMPHSPDRRSIRAYHHFFLLWPFPSSVRILQSSNQPRGTTLLHPL